MEKYLAVRDTLVEPYVREYEVMRGDEHVFVLCHTKLITLANGDRVSLTSVMNITENKKFEQRLLVQSRMDALTKICNRGYGEAQIEKLLKAKKMVCSCCLMSISLSISMIHMDIVLVMRF